MTLMNARGMVLATGAALAAACLLVGACSKGGSDVADTGGADPSAVTKATDSAAAGAPTPGYATTGPGSIDSAGVVSTAGSAGPAASAPASSLGSDSRAAAPPASSSASSADTSSSPGRATGPR